MAKERDSPEDLFNFAQALVWTLKRRHQRNWNEHRMEDAAQDLFLAGFQVWQVQGHLGEVAGWRQFSSWLAFREVLEQNSGRPRRNRVCRPPIAFVWR